MVKQSGEIVKLCNNKHLHLIMVKWCKDYVKMVQIIHTSSHGEMVKKSIRDILFSKFQHSETFILPFVRTLFHSPLWGWGPIPLIDSIRCCICRLYIHCLCMVTHWLSYFPTSCSNAFQCRIPPLLFIDTFLIFLHSNITNTRVEVPFVNLLIITIALCSCTGSILFISELL